MQKIVINFTKPDLNYATMKSVNGDKKIIEFPIDITPAMSACEGSEELYKPIEFKQCKCKAIVELKIKSKLIDIQECENLTVLGSISNLKGKDGCFELDEIDDWFIDTYFRRVDDDKDVELKVSLVSDELEKQLAEIVITSDFDGKVNKAKETLGKKIKIAADLSKMPEETKTPKIKGGAKGEAKKL